MNSKDRNGHGSASIDDRVGGGRRRSIQAQRALEVDQAAAHAEQTPADADQTLSDADQTFADADQSASGSDQTSADQDQRASDDDQARADRDHEARSDRTADDELAYETARDERTTGSFERLMSRLRRAAAASDRETSAALRDRTAATRDEAGSARDAKAADIAAPTSEIEAFLLQQLEELRAKAAVDRARAAADRDRAARDRANAALDRARLEGELRSAHLDELTGAYRREMGQLALSHEIDRARRSDGRFVLAFVDVDRLKDINDREGHAAGDRVLQTVVRAMRTKLRSFDPIVRYGGDEFVCGLGGTDIPEAERRFRSIGVAVQADARVGISVGLTALESGDTTEELTERADAAMLEVKAQHHSGR